MNMFLLHLCEEKAPAKHYFFYEMKLWLRDGQSNMWWHKVELHWFTFPFALISEKGYGQNSLQRLHDVPKDTLLNCTCSYLKKKCEGN